uniref:Cytochrome P450 n=1 Tax=Globisporangium ultimum (strain ATCC 200006 / CBS 805.95 / DAOM BR144) TaxID=431595 RepID=K3X953_GLOUD
MSMLSTVAVIVLSTLVAGLLFVVVPRLSASPKAIDAKKTTIRALPCATSTLPVLESMLDILVTHRDRMYDWATDQCKLLEGRPWAMYIFGRGPGIVILSLELLKDVLKTQFNQFPKEDNMCTVFRDFFGRGILATNGDE